MQRQWTNKVEHRSTDSQPSTNFPARCNRPLVFLSVVGLVHALVIICRRFIPFVSRGMSPHKLMAMHRKHAARPHRKKKSEENKTGVLRLSKLRVLSPSAFHTRAKPWLQLPTRTYTLAYCYNGIRVHPSFGLTSSQTSASHVTLSR